MRRAQPVYRSVGVIVGLAMVGCTALPIQQAEGPSPPPTTTATESSTATPPIATSSPSPTRTDSQAAEWTHVAGLGDGMGWDLAIEVARGRDAFVAIGTRYVRAPEIIFARPREYIWVSGDGHTWDEVSLGPDFDGVTLGDVISTADGGFVLFGSEELTGRAWDSSDGRTWHAIETSWGPDLVAGAVVQGARGYLLGASELLSSEGSLWHSRDGTSWEEVQHFTADDVVLGTIRAGDEGFVAIGSRRGLDGQPVPMVFASADGLTWLEAPQSFGLTPETACFAPVLTSVGGDWIVVIAMLDGSATVWASANGLDWQSQGSIANLGTTPCEPLALTFAGGLLLLSPSVAFHSLSSVVWSSTDGRTWEAWQAGADAVVIAAIDSPDGAVAVGAAVQGPDASLASFWFSPPRSP